MQANSTDLGVKVKSMLQLYNILAKDYYLPDFSSKAITKDYLLKYCAQTISIFTIKKVEVIHHNYRIRKYSSIELFKLLQDTLKTKDLPNVGLEIPNIPDQGWLKNVLLFLDKEDPHGLLDSAPVDNLSFHVNVNQE